MGRVKQIYQEQEQLLCEIEAMSTKRLLDLLNEPYDDFVIKSIRKEIKRRNAFLFRM